MNVTKNKIKQLQSGKKIHDGRGLYFFKKGDKGRWSFRYQRDGRCHEMGCGTYPEISILMAIVLTIGFTIASILLMQSGKKIKN